MKFNTRKVQNDFSLKNIMFARIEEQYRALSEIDLGPIL